MDDAKYLFYVLNITRLVLYGISTYPRRLYWDLLYILYRTMEDVLRDVYNI
jgi:hypothetical protein